MEAKKSHHQHGLGLIELAASICVVFLFAYLCLWAGIMLTARATLSTAIDKAARMAATRTNPILSGALTTLNATNPNLYLGVAADPNFYNSCLTRKAVNPELQQQHWYTIALILAAMKESLGSAVRSPCLPGASTQLNWLNREESPSCSVSFDPTPNGRDGSGCLACEFITDEWIAAGPGGQSSAAGTLNPDHVIVECTYQPVNSVLSPLIGLMRFLGLKDLGWITARGRGIFSRNEA